MDTEDDVQLSFSYKEPIINGNVNLFHSNNVPWFYHLLNILQLKGNEFSEIKEFVTAEKKKIENDHILSIINFKTYTDEMLKLDTNLRNTISVYLYYCKHQLEKYSADLEYTNVKFVFVFGNITADMDSISSSILFSFFLFLWNELKIKSCKRKEGAKKKFFIPVVNIKKTDIKLKVLILWWMKKIEVYDPQHIFVFQDSEHLLKVLKNKDKYDICLIDFNDFESSNIYDVNNIKCIIDHHMSKEVINERQITKSIFPICVCSCMVIIAYMYKHASQFLGVPFVNKNMMWLIYGTILRDSNNFRKEDRWKRWVLPDLNIFNSLKKFYKISKKMDIFLTYEFELIRFSIDLKKFGIENLLLMDYKEYRYNVIDKKIQIRIASIDFSIDRLFADEDSSILIKKLFEVCKENNLCLFIFIGSYLDNRAQLNKDMGLFFYADDFNSTALINKLSSDKCMNILEKSVKTITYGNQSKSLNIYHVNRKYSRKMMEYVLRDFFHKP